MKRGTSVAFNRWFARGWLSAGYVFLYLPIVALVLFSFNDSPIPNVWRGFTLKWYAALADDREIQAGLWLSLKIAFLTACGSVVLGTLAAFALVKYKRFTRAHAVQRHGQCAAGHARGGGRPVAAADAGVGAARHRLSRARLMTIWFGHLLLGMAYAAVIVQARLLDLNPSLEEAAMDLGAKPAQVFWLVTLPMISQSLLSAWLLTFTISLDDVVLSAFLSGPGATTMPLVIFSRARLGPEPERQCGGHAHRRWWWPSACSWPAT